MQDTNTPNTSKTVTSELVSNDTFGTAENASKKDGRVTHKSLLGHFSGNQEGMDTFLAYCFMIQRVNTGGINIRELGVIHSIKDSLINDHNLDKESLKAIVQAINTSDTLYEMFASGTSEFNYIKEQSPVNYCKIMSKYLPNDCGLRLEINLTGDVDKDLVAVENLLELFKDTDISRLLSINNAGFSLEFTNPWKLIFEHTGKKLNMPANTVVVACEHPEQQGSSYYIIKTLVTVANSLSRRIELKPEVDAKSVIKERPSALDDDLDRDSFMELDPDFLAFSSRKPRAGSARTSRIFYSETIEVNEPESDEEDETHEPQEQATGIKGFVGNIGNKLSSVARLPFFKKTQQQEGEPQDAHAAYTILLTNAIGEQKEYEDLFWELIEGDDEHYWYQKVVSQIFYHCVKTKSSDIKANVKDYINGSWYDVAQGYLLTANYKVTKEEEA